MNKTIAVNGLFLLIILAIGCTKSTSPSTGSQTHFLKDCEQEKCKAPYSCICGVCTQSCKSDRICSDIFEAATCVASSEIKRAGLCEEGESTDKSVCDIECNRDSDCSEFNDDFLCQGGFCRKNSEKIPIVADMGVPAYNDGDIIAEGGMMDAVADTKVPTENDNEIVAEGGSANDFDTLVDINNPQRNRVTPGNICDRLSAIQCAGEQNCCDDPALDFEGCKQGMLQLCRDEIRIDAISADPLTGFDSIFAEQAFTEFENMASRCDTSIVAWGASFEGLRGILKGTIDRGMPCTPSGDGGETLDEAGAIALASCKNPQNTACAHPAVLLWTCSPRNSVGGACITDANCIEGLYCDNPNLLLLGATCKVRKAVGASCDWPNECASLICKNGACVEANRQNVYCLSQP